MAAATESIELFDHYLSAPVFEYLKEKIVQRKLPDAALKTRIGECLKFLSLIHLCPGNIPVSQEVDEIWHLLILETREYMDLCKKLPGGEYIHHQSKVLKGLIQPRTDVQDEAGAEQNKQAEEEIQRSLSWLASYFVNFGPFGEDTVIYWPAAMELLEDIRTNHGTLSDLNDLLEALAAK